MLMVKADALSGLGDDTKVAPVTEWKEHLVQG